jgi:hypothetical protein
MPLILTLTGWSGFTTMVIEFEAAGLLSTQMVFEEVRVQFITSPFNGM